MLVFDPKRQLAEPAKTVGLRLDEIGRLTSFLAGQQSTLELKYQVLGNCEQMLLALEMTGEVGVYCQRCLRAMILPFNRTATYQVIKNTDLPMVEGQQYEEILLIDNRIDLSEVVADEILLSLPAKHDFDCELESPFMAKENGIGVGRDNPFSALKNLCEH